jgi:flavin reductase (DIM6/NTAB) family NADH-FMN oxidoreductase RutF
MNRDQAADDAEGQYAYAWPREALDGAPGWRKDGPFHVREMPETREEIARDSRWPGFFPSPLCLVTTAEGSRTGLEKVVGASIVNRFPYIVALSFCRETLSERHYERRAFMDLLERGGNAAVQFLPPGAELDRAMATIAEVPDAHVGERVDRTGLRRREALTIPAPVFESSYLVYEAKFVRPGHDFSRGAIHELPWIDIGSHRIYFLEITAIQLREDIAKGDRAIQWTSLPKWSPLRERRASAGTAAGADPSRYQKGYTPHYRFPSSGTVAFERDATIRNMAVKYLPPLPEDQVEVDNDRARWPCFFPSSVGLITTWQEQGVANIMPCGSTTVVSRHPLVISPCVSYAAINERYAPRETLQSLRSRGKFGCGVPFIDASIIDAIKYAGTTSIRQDPRKAEHSGLAVTAEAWAPVLHDLPVHFDCEVVGERALGTHIMFYGEVKRIRVRTDVNPGNPLRWCPWARID